MNRIFAITTAMKGATLLLGEDRQGKVAFTVTNSTPRALRGQLRIRPLDAAKAEWLNITGEQERDFSANATQQVEVAVNIPGTIPPGKYSFRLDAVSVVNPDEDFTEGPNFALEVQPTEVKNTPFPWWIIAVAVAVLVTVAVLAWLLMPRHVSVPQVTGKDVAEARKTIEQANLQATVNEQPTRSAAPGQVISQAPEAGKKVAKASLVTLLVASAPGPPKEWVNLIALAPAATWISRNGIHHLPWNGSDGDGRGFALLRTNVMLEDQTIYKTVLETHPEWINFGDISGDFILPEPIQAGDRLKAKVGFLNGAQAGDVTFVVAAWNEAPTNLLVVHREQDRATDGKLKTLDIDLRPVAGRKVIRLSVEAGPSSAQDWAVWVEPRIER